MFCSNCGKNFTSKFCPECGKPTEEASTYNTYIPEAQPYVTPIKKKKGFLKPILIVFAVFFFIGIIGSTGDDSKPVIKNSSSSMAKEPEKPKEVIALVGETLDYNGLKLTLNSVENYVDNSKYPTSKLEDSNIFVVLRFTAENGTKEDEYINMFYEESYCDDIAIDPQSIMFNIKGETLWGDIAVGKKRQGYICYEVPSDWKTLEFYYLPELFGSAKMMFKVTPSDIK